VKVHRHQPTVSICRRSWLLALSLMFIDYWQLLDCMTCLPVGGTGVRGLTRDLATLPSQMQPRAFSGPYSIFHVGAGLFQPRRLRPLSGPIRHPQEYS